LGCIKTHRITSAQQKLINNQKQQYHPVLIHPWDHQSGRSFVVKSRGQPRNKILMLRWTLKQKNEKQAMYADIAASIKNFL